MKKIRGFILLLIIGSQIVFATERSDSDLLQEVARVCVSGNHEKSDCEIMREASQRFDISELDTLVSMHCSRTLDIGDRRLKTVTSKLLMRSEKLFGQISIEAFKCRRAKISAYMENDISAELANINVECASRLLERYGNRSDIQELYLLAQLEYLSAQSDQVGDYDNPKRWEQVYRIEKQVDELYCIKSEDSYERMHIYLYLGHLKRPEYGVMHIDYLNKLFRDAYPEESGSPILSISYPNGVISNACEYYRLAYEMSCRIYGSNSLYALGCLYNYFQMRVYEPTEDDYRQLKKMYNQVKSYCAIGDYFPIRVLLLMWDYVILTGNKADETFDYKSVLGMVKNYYGEESKTYLDCLCSVQIIIESSISLEQAKIFAEEYFKIVKVLYKDNSEKQLACLIYQFDLMKELAEKENFAEYVDKLINMYSNNHKPSWLSFSNGYNLSLKLDNILRLEDATKVLEVAIKDLKQIVGEKSIIYLTKLNELANCYRSIRDYAGAENVFLKILQLDDEGSLKSSIYSDLSNLYRDINDIDKGICILRKGVEECQSDIIGNIYLRLALAFYLMQKQINEIGYIKDYHEIDVIMQSASSDFLLKENDISGLHLDGYLMISSYYQEKKDYDVAEEVLLRGLNRCQEIGGSYNQTFLEVVTEIYNLYLYQFNDFNKAEQLISGHIEYLRRVMPYNHDIILDLLMKKYMLLRVKISGSGDLGYMLGQIMEESFALAKNLGEEEAFKQIKSVLAFLCAEIISQSAPLKTGFREEDVPVAYRPHVQSMITQMNTSLLDFEKVFRRFSKDYMSDFDYIVLVESISQFYAHYENNYNKAVEWQKKLLDSPVAKERAIQGLANLYLVFGNFCEAVELYEQVLQSSYYKTTSVTDKYTFCSLYFEACYKAGLYEKALKVAKELKKYRSEVVNNNFEMMTQSEREAFWKNGGIGGFGMEMLLHRYPQELSGEVYDCLLQEKGMLLRATERFRRSIMSSGNEDLIKSLKTLDRLKAEHAREEYMPNSMQGDYTVSAEYIYLHEKIEMLEKKIKIEGKKYFEQIDTVYNWQDIQMCLSQNEVAIEFVLSDSITGALVLKPGMSIPQYVPLTNSRKLNAELEYLNKFAVEEQIERLYQYDECGLYAKLWKPLEPFLSDVEQIYFSPTGYLNTLAFSAIRCPNGEYLMERYKLHQLTTTAEIVKKQKSKSVTGNKSALLIGAVYYSPEQEDIAKEVALMGKVSGERSVVEDEFGYLPSTKDEIEKINDVMNHFGYDCKLYSGHEATERNLALADGRSYEILHLSTHGFFVTSEADVLNNRFLEKYPNMRFSSMYRTGLAFVGANQAWEGQLPEGGNDGILTSYEVSGLNLKNTRLAVLSACQTAVGFYSKEGVFGMNRGFKQAGVKSIIASLWQVNDESTSVFMSKFYSKWLSGLSMQQSFNETMTELKEQYKSPYYWAPFILVDAN